MASIQERIKKDGSKHYRVLIRIHGLPTVSKTFNRITDAKMWAAQHESAIRRGDIIDVVSVAKSKTLSDVIKTYREEGFCFKAENTRKKENTYLKFWDKELGDYSLSHLKPDVIDKKLRELLHAGDTRQTKNVEFKPKAIKTVKLYKGILSILFQFAQEKGWIGQSPMNSLRKLPKDKNRRARFLSESERDNLLAACKASPNPQLYPIVIFALSTGARLGEIIGLKTEDLCLDADRAILRDTKNGETRSVPVVGYLADVMNDHLTWLEKFDVDTPYLFPRLDGLKPIDIRKAWMNAREKSGIQDFRFHDLRHSAASYLAMNGATLLEIAEVLGHKTLQMVKRYSHLSESHTKKIVTKMNKKIF